MDKQTQRTLGVSNEFWYWVLIALSVFVFADIYILGKILKIPFFGVNVLYPVAESLFAQNTAYAVLGWYSYSWALFALAAYAAKPRVEESDEMKEES